MAEPKTWKTWCPGTRWRCCAARCTTPNLEPADRVVLAVLSADLRPGSATRDGEPDLGTPGAWVAQQARNLLMDLDRAAGLRFLLREGAPRKRFRGALGGHRTREYANRMLIVGERHLAAVLNEYTSHYNGHRPHRSLRQQPPKPPTRAVGLNGARVQRQRILGGLINEYSVAA
jgi:hypothetical protein